MMEHVAPQDGSGSAFASPRKFRRWIPRVQRGMTPSEWPSQAGPPVAAKLASSGRRLPSLQMQIARIEHGGVAQRRGIENRHAAVPQRDQARRAQFL